MTCSLTLCLLRWEEKEDRAGAECPWYKCSHMPLTEREERYRRVGV